MKANVVMATMNWPINLVDRTENKWNKRMGRKK